MKHLILFVFLCLFSTLSIAAPSTPSRVTAIGKNIDDIFISWSAVTGATHYERQYNVNNTGWSTNTRVHYSTSVTFTNQPERTTQYRIRACDNSGCSGWRVSGSVTLPVTPSAPSSVTASVSNGNDIVISWSAVSGATHYERQYNKNSNGWLPNTPNQHTGTSVTFENQPPNQFIYRMRACVNSLCSGWKTSNSITVPEPPSAPASVTASVSNGNDIVISWSAVSGATHYERQYNKNSNGWLPNTPNQHTGTSVTFENQPPNQFIYRMRACVNSLCSGWRTSNSITVPEPPSAPASVTASVSNGNDIVISWSAVSGATHYERQYNKNSNGWLPNTPNQHTGTSVTFENQPPNQFIYRMRACVNSLCSGWRTSNSISVPEVADVVWSKTVLTVGEAVGVEGLLPVVSYCISDSATPIRFVNSHQIIFYQTTSGNLNWACFDSSNQQVQQFSSNLTINRLPAPVNLEKQ